MVSEVRMVEWRIERLQYGVRSMEYGVGWSHNGVL